MLVLIFRFSSNPLINNHACLIISLVTKQNFLDKSNIFLNFYFGVSNFQGRIICLFVRVFFTFYVKILNVILISIFKQLKNSLSILFPLSFGLFLLNILSIVFSIYLCNILLFFFFRWASGKVESFHGYSSVLKVKRKSYHFCYYKAIRKRTQLYP